MKRTKLFITAFLQVSLVSANIYFVGQRMWIAIASTSFLISYLWTINVKKIAISKLKDRLTYAFGAMFGGLTGVIVAQTINQFL